MIEGVNNKIGKQISQLSLLAQQVAETQERISSGQKLLRPSDDIIASARIAQLRRSAAANDGWNENLEFAQSTNSQAQTNITNASSQVARLSELLLNAISEQGTAEDRTSIAAEINNVADTLDELAESLNSLGNPLFETGQAISFRVGANTTVTPVLRRSEIFDMSGNKISDTIRDMATAVLANDKTAINDAITGVTDIITHFADANGRLGLVGQRIERSMESIFDRSTDISKEMSGLADVDLNVAIAQLNQQTLTLQAAQAAFARINRQSLMDLLG